MFNLTTEEKRMICEEYSDKSISVGRIAEKWHMSRRDLTNIALEMGAEPRRPKAWGKRNSNKNHICPKCRKTVEIKGARFCPFCGTDIRSKNEILIEKLQRVIGFLPLLPENDAEEARIILVETMETLKSNDEGV